jgi:predicted phosphodiesterase
MGGIVAATAEYIEEHHMRVALFSDIHGNYTGLQAVLAAIRASGGADLTIAAGDHVGGGSGGDDLLDLLAQHQVLLVRGDGDTDEKYIRLAQEARERPGTTRNSLAYYLGMPAWLQRHISAANRELLANLPFSHSVEVAPGQRLYVCHASPRAIDDPICAPGTASDVVHQAYSAVDAGVIAFGHWHQPYTRWLAQRLYVNVASVGFRHDGLSRYTMLTYQAGQWVVEQHAVPYDVEAERDRCEQRHVPLPDP